jgi:O-6-methylguanine DNA methyltransferase
MLLSLVLHIPKQMDVEIIQTDVGLLGIASRNGYIRESYFISEGRPTNHNQLLIDRTLNYFNGTYTTITSNYKVSGTFFQRLVWKAICQIPYGQTRTYGQIAESIGHPNSCRAVANACGQNKLVIIIPCHRVVGKDNLGGYKWGWKIKKRLLDLEAYYS